MDEFDDLSINTMLVDIAQQEIDNVAKLRNIVEKDLSKCYCSLKIMCEIYEQVYNRSNAIEKAALEEIGLDDLVQERNFIDCLFQLEKNFKIVDVDIELLKDSIGLNDKGVDATIFFNIFDEFSELYPEVMKGFDDCVELSKTNNSVFFETLKSGGSISNSEDERVEFRLKNLSDEQIKILNEFTKVHGYIAEFMKNSEEANEFVTEPFDSYTFE